MNDGASAQTYGGDTLNERGCAFMCFILTAICAVLSWNSMKTGGGEGMSLICFFAFMVVLLSGFVIIWKFVP